MNIELAVNVLLVISAAGMWIACGWELRKILRGDDSSIASGPPSASALLVPALIGVLALGGVVPLVSAGLVVLAQIPLGLLSAFKEGIRFQRSGSTAVR
ncbi:MAG: hypothetical protein S0880_22310 [Actinomycetota bacterium]|nr:hypothetical protein [Actinomycetota bacterium]